MIAGMKFVFGVIVAIAIFYGLLGLIANSLLKGSGHLAGLIILAFIASVVFGLAGLIGHALGF